MASRSTALPSRLFSSAEPWILIRSTVVGFAPGITGGTSVFTWANDTSAAVHSKPMNFVKIRLLFDRDHGYRLRRNGQGQLAALHLRPDALGNYNAGRFESI